MTVKEAIKLLKYNSNVIHKIINGETVPNEVEALEMAIKALEQQPCDDCISRKEVNVLVDELARAISDERCFMSRGRSTANIMQDILDLPSVTPKQKTGRWLTPQQDDGMSDPIYYQVRCSECGFDLDPQTWHMELHQYGADKYCPKCGAVMAESEDKE